MMRYYVSEEPRDWRGIRADLYQYREIWEVRDHQQEGKIVHLCRSKAEADDISRLMSTGQWFAQDA